MIEAAAIGLQHLMAFQALFYLALGAAIGFTFGVIPGLGGPTALALLIPLTFGMDSFTAMSLFGGIMGAVHFGGSIPAILINTPGTPVNAATCFDGYPMAQKGMAGMAIAAAATSCAVGGVVGIAFLIACLPVMRELVLLFGPPEFLMMALLGLSAIAVATPGQQLRGLVMGGFGLMLAYVGFDRVHGGERYTFGSDYLWDGVPLVPALIGLFAVAQVMRLAAGNERVSSVSADTRLYGVWAGVKAVFANYGTLLRGSAIGAFIGPIPGVGGSIASFIAYTATVNFSKNPEGFGKGDIRGVIGPEACHNAKDGSSLIPTLAFGIPGSSEMAVFLGALVLHGLQPGPLLILQHPDVIFTLIFALLFACICSSLLGLVMTRWLAPITRLDPQILSIVVPVIGFVGAYALRESFGDVVVAMTFGLLGYLMMRFDYPRLSLVIALVLGNLAEVSFFQSIQIVRGDWATFFARPPVAILTLLIVACLGVPVIRRRLAERSPRVPRPLTAAPEPKRSEFVFQLVLFSLIAGYIATSYSYAPLARMVPLAVAWATLGFLVLEFLSMWDTPLRPLITTLFPRNPPPAVQNVITREIEAILWPIGLVSSAYLIGFLPTIPIFAVLSLVFRARRPALRAAAIALGLLLSVWLAFHVLLRFDLYTGVLFGTL
ncbi:MAG TPA: tripartite tricarboxylate transporter permease [Candidatus Binataceae bacterium]|nr:tripartite tricarboxylate transporter permease [Candidatus Binataceae bacterium]